MKKIDKLADKLKVACGEVRTLSNSLEFKLHIIDNLSINVKDHATNEKNKLVEQLVDELQGYIRQAHATAIEGCYEMFRPTQGRDGIKQKVRGNLFDNRQKYSKRTIVQLFFSPLIRRFNHVRTSNARNADGANPSDRERGTGSGRVSLPRVVRTRALVRLFHPEFRCLDAWSSQRGGNLRSQPPRWLDVRRSSGRSRLVLYCCSPETQTLRL